MFTWHVSVLYLDHINNVNLGDPPDGGRPEQHHQDSEALRRPRPVPDLPDNPRHEVFFLIEAQMSFFCSQVRPLRGDNPQGLEAFKHRRQRGLRAQDPRLWPGKVKV